MSIKSLFRIFIYTQNSVMKNQIVNRILLLLATSLFFSSCFNKMSKNAGALEFDSLQINRTEHLFSDTAKPACNLIVNFAYIAHSTNPAMQDSLNKYFTSACFGASYQNLSPQEAVEHYAQQYITNYRQDLEPLYLKEEQDEDNDGRIGAWYSYYKGMESHVMFYQSHLLVYQIDYNEYTGGAHGIYQSTFLNMDLHTLKPIRLEDIFVENYQEPLTDLLWNQLMADNNVASRQELENLGYGMTDDLAPTENFYLTPEGITFHYNVYEIAPYVMGAIQISLPYQIMEHLLSADSSILSEIRTNY